MRAFTNDEAMAVAKAALSGAGHSWADLDQVTRAVVISDTVRALDNLEIMQWEIEPW